ncbi:MAG: hypothetical protein M5U01_16175 [Ardenticatenaceae bacterium]|nr:hypothetical protein [Ardenticatenaceae bacterium]
MDLSFIGKPHEYDPRRVYSTTGADWQDRVNFDRLRRERLARAEEQMGKHDLGALVLFQGANIRSITGSYQGNWKYNIFIRMYFAIETFAGHPGLQQTVRLEENVLVTPDGPVVTTLAPFADGMLDHLGY